MIDLGKMNADLTIGNEEARLRSMQNSLYGKDITNMFKSEPKQEQPEPVVNFDQWKNMYNTPEPVQEMRQEPQQSTTQVQEVVEKKDEFNLDSWLNSLSGNSVKNDVVVEQPKQEQQIQQEPVKPVNSFEEIMNQSYTILGQAAQQRGFNPDEIVEMAQKITPQDILDLYEMRKYQEQMKNSKPIPGASIIGDPSNYRGSNSFSSVAGIGARNVKI